MTQNAPLASSVAACGSGIGRRAAMHLDLSFRTMTRHSGGELGPLYLRWVTREAHPMGNLVIAAGEGDAASMREATAPLVQANLPSTVIFPSGASGAASAALLDAGFADIGSMPAMAVDIDRLSATAMPEGYTFRRAGPDASGDAWAEALAVGYHMPPSLGRRFAPSCMDVDMGSDAAIQFFSIERDGAVVATSTLFLADGLAGIYCVATREEHRKRGLGAHVTAEPLRIARRLGYRVGVLQSSSAGHPVYLGLGFADVATIPMFARMPKPGA
ncbi:MAG: GNAT family N-acetyltransferase [Burkholderiales bacterium]